MNSLNEENEIPEVECVKTKNENGEKKINGYTVLRTLGYGAFSKVKLVEKDGVKYAMKVIDKMQLRKKKKGFSKNTNGKILVDLLFETEKSDEVHEFGRQDVTFEVLRYGN